MSKIFVSEKGMRTCAELAKEFCDKAIEDNDCYMTIDLISAFKSCSDFPKDPEVISFECTWGTYGDVGEEPDYGPIKYPSREVIKSMIGRRWKITATEVR